MKINGVDLDNSVLGWALHDATMPRMEVKHELTRARRAGRDGATVAAFTREPCVMRIVVSSPDSTRQELLSLFSAPTLTIARNGLMAEGRLASSSPEKYEDHLGWGQDAFLLEIPGGCWRDSTESTTAHIAAAAGGATVSLLSGISAPVQDATIRFKGPLEKPQIVDSSGAFIAVDGTLTASEYLRFDSNTGRAWSTTSDAWSGGDEVSGLVDFGGPRGVFEITPKFTTPANPTVRAGSLTLTQQSFGAGAGVQVRAKAAYLF